MTPLEQQARDRGVRVPSAPTLKKYGLTAEEWLELVAAQDWRCRPCLRPLVPQHYPNTDHEHVPGWKRLPPEERKRFVRGVLCARCNRWLVESRLPAETSQRITDYLRAYEARRDA